MYQNNKNRENEVKRGLKPQNSISKISQYTWTTIDLQRMGNWDSNQFYCYIPNNKRGFLRPNQFETTFLFQNRNFEGLFIGLYKLQVMVLTNELE